MNRIVGRFVALPDPIKAGIVSVVAFGVGVLFVWGAGVPVLAPIIAFLAQYQLAIVGALGVALVKLIENALPDQYPEISVLAVKIILLVLAAYGIGTGVAGLLF